MVGGMQNLVTMQVFLGPIDIYLDGIGISRNLLASLTKIVSVGYTTKEMKAGGWDADDCHHAGFSGTYTKINWYDRR
jgi:hypothetical protein